ncbi:MAG: hypothetical protein AB7O65_04225 [Candidatus Korobacteraceae bacterium]
MRALGKLVLLITLALAAYGGILAQQAPPSQQSAAAPARSASAQSAQAKAAQTKQAAASGARLFQIHCRRCHQPPQSLSPKAAKTVLMHMRVRALLPEEDYQRILQFLAP